MAIITTDPSGVIHGTPDADTITAGLGTVLAGAGDDTITGGFEVFIYGEEGNDTISDPGFDGGYYLDGGPGDDRIEGLQATVGFAAATGGVTVDLAINTPQAIGGGMGVDTLVNIHSIIATPFNDSLHGMELPDKFYAGDGDDLIEGRGGDDWIYASRGNDTVDGGDGADTINFKIGGTDWTVTLPTATSAMHIDLNNIGAQDVGGGFGTMTIRNVEGLAGGNFGNVFTGDESNDTLSGGAGDDSLFGGNGNDQLGGGNGYNYLRGGEGDDALGGGNDFDDMLGNQGADTMRGGLGNDWVIGGQDNDQCLGDDGDDIVYGNLGNDVLFGNNGNDIVRGGQGNDDVEGGAGNDFVAGDRGDDTLVGGQGADRFYSFADAGTDRVTDFNRAEGDRVEIQTGDTWTVAQDGADTVITVSGSATLILAGVSMSSLTGDWIFSGVG